MVRGDGLVKVLDFGLARRDDAALLDLQGETIDPRQTGPGVVLGTVAYMSPEQSRGRSVDGRTDLWSLGVVLYEMLAGRQPFEGDSSIDVFASILHREPSPLTLVRDDLPAGLDAIAGRALAKQIARRYRTARELRADLLDVAAGLGAAADLGRLASPDAAAPAPSARRASAAAGSAARHSIAVLPFRNLSTDAGNDYFCDGLAEELLNALSKIDGLKVAARTSAFAFKGGRESISEIGTRPGRHHGPRGERPFVGQPDADRGAALERGGRVPGLVRALRPPDGRHLRRPGRDHPGGGRRAQAPALRRNARGGAEAGHRGPRGPRPLPQGALLLEPAHARVAAAGGRALPAGDRRGSRLRPRLRGPRRGLRALRLAERRAAAREHAARTRGGAARPGARRERRGGARRARRLPLLLRLGPARVGAGAAPRRRAQPGIGDRPPLARQHRVARHGPLRRVARRGAARRGARSALSGDRLGHRRHPPLRPPLRRGDRTVRDGRSPPRRSSTWPATTSDRPCIRAAVRKRPSPSTSAAAPRPTTPGSPRSSRARWRAPAAARKRSATATRCSPRRAAATSPTSPSPSSMPRSTSRTRRSAGWSATSPSVRSFRLSMPTTRCSTSCATILRFAGLVERVRRLRLDGSGDGAPAG